MRAILASALWQKSGVMMAAGVAARIADRCCVRMTARLTAGLTASLAACVTTCATTCVMVRMSARWPACWSACLSSRTSAKRTLAASTVLLAALSSGCSTVDFAWSMGPAALGFMAGSYLDLDGDQETLLKERLLATREWVRVTQVPEYARLLAEASTRVSGKVTHDDALWLTVEGRRQASLAGARVAAEIVNLTPRLTSDNLAALKKKFARNNAEFTGETIEVSPQKQRELRFKRVREQFERWYGDFDDAQLERMKSLSDALPMQPRLMLQDRVRRQNAMLALLAGLIDKSISRSEGEQRLTILLTEFERGRSAQYQAVASAYLAQAQAMIVQVAGMATPAQRETAQRRLKRWADDLAKLAARNEP